MKLGGRNIAVKEMIEGAGRLLWSGISACQLWYHSESRCQCAIKSIRVVGTGKSVVITPYHFEQKRGWKKPPWFQCGLVYRVYFPKIHPRESVFPVVGASSMYESCSGARYPCRREHPADTPSRTIMLNHSPEKATAAPPIPDNRKKPNCQRLSYRAHL